MGPRDPPIFDSPPHFTPTIGVPDPLGAIAPHPNGQKGSKKAQKGQKWLKMAKNGPKRGSGRHQGPRDPPILTSRPILHQLQGVSGNGSLLAPPKWLKRVKKAPKGQKWLTMTKHGPKTGSRCHWGHRDPPILTPGTILHQL